MAHTAVTVIVALVGVLGFVCVLLMASVGTVVRLGESDDPRQQDARPLLARRHPARVPHSAAGVDAAPSVPEPVVPALPAGPVNDVARAVVRDEARTAA